MNNSKLKIEYLRLLLGVLCFAFFAQYTNAQSTDQSFPTAITANEISGNIPARDIGDARQTGYYYVFNAAQGDVFINVVTANLNGDIDVFTADNLRPLTKITVYADAADSETGRVVYLRQPTKLILRIEGRTPNDEPATFRIKFAGSFLPAQINSAEKSESPTVKTDNQTDVRVNSVGTIIEVKPKPTPKPKETISETKSTREAELKEQKAKEEADKVAADAEEKRNQKATREKEADAYKEKKTAADETEAKPVVLTTDALPTKEQSETEVAAEAKKDSTEKADEKTSEPIANKNAAEEEILAKTEPKKTEKPKPVKSLPLAALENIRLIVLFKDGSKIERPMSEIIKVGVDKGVLTITSKDGAVGRYSILDVEKMTIE
jgi:hypothetical protein